jgi:hypothetical protein
MIREAFKLSTVKCAINVAKPISERRYLDESKTGPMPCVTQPGASER